MVLGKLQNFFGLFLVTKGDSRIEKWFNFLIKDVNRINCKNPFFPIISDCLYPFFKLLLKVGLKTKMSMSRKQNQLQRKGSSFAGSLRRNSSKKDLFTTVNDGLRQHYLRTLKPFEVGAIWYQSGSWPASHFTKIINWNLG